MRRLALLLALLFAAVPAHAQFSRILNISLLNNDNSVAAFNSDPFSIKVGAACTWSVTATVATINCSGGSGGSPASPSGSIQYNNAGSFGALPEWANGSADCDGFGDPCDVLITSSSTFRYFLFGTNSNGAAGNNFNCYNFTDGGVYCSSTDGTNAASMSFSPTDGNSGMFVNIGTRVTGFNLSSDRVVNIGRLGFSSSYTTSLSSMAFTLSSGWGNTASVGATGGSDNAFVFSVTAGGTGIVANPTVTYTYVDGDYSTAGSATPIFVCTQTGGNDIYADASPTAPGQTSVVITWFGTPTTAKTYTISCHDFQRS